jgi:hypothetical protein
MAINFVSGNPAGLLAKFKKAIDDKHVRTWSYDADGDFTHNVEQWNRKAWLRPSVSNGQLIFNMLKPQNSSVSWEVFGVYQGRFVESMTVHCHDNFSQAFATAKPTANDF